MLSHWEKYLNCLGWNFSEKILAETHTQHGKFQPKQLKYDKILSNWKSCDKKYSKMWFHQAHTENVIEGITLKRKLLFPLYWDDWKSWITEHKRISALEQRLAHIFKIIAGPSETSCSGCELRVEKVNVAEDSLNLHTKDNKIGEDATVCLFGEKDKLLYSWKKPLELIWKGSKVRQLPNYPGMQWCLQHWMKVEHTR